MPDHVYDYEPCSKTVSTWCLDMGDNLNANGAAPVAPYVFLSFLFEIMVEFMFLLCILLLC